MLFLQAYFKIKDTETFNNKIIERYESNKEKTCKSELGV